MKENQQHQPRIHSTSSSKNCTRATAYALLLFFSYLLGYLSASSSKPQHPLTPTPFTPDQSPEQTNPPAANFTAGAITDDHFLFSGRCAPPLHPKHVRRTIIDRVFNGTSPYDGFPPPHVGKLLRRKRVKGWGSYGAVFENLIRQVRPRIIIEVGTFLGASALHMAELTRKLGLRKTQIICVDDFRGWPGFQDRFGDIKMLNGDVLLMYQFMQNVVQANATGSVLFVPFSTGSALDVMCSWGVSGDLIEVDAGHDFHAAWADINRAHRLLRPGGVLFGHDYFLSADNRGVRRAVQLFARVKGLRVRVDGQHWVLESV